MTDSPRKRKFVDHRAIPVGYYDNIVRKGNPVRRLWHLSKFETVLECLPDRPGQSVLDVGCFAGTFLSLIPEERFSRQVGVDVLPDQVTYANEHWGRRYREFRPISSLADLKSIDEEFDCVTVIEVLEHLRSDEIRTLFEAVVERLRPGGMLVVTTPNYASAWPVVERVVNRWSDVSYEDQHISRFTYWNLERELERIYPDLFDAFSAVTLKKTSHALIPYLAALSFDLAHRLSRAGARRKRTLPFGSIVLLALTRTTNRGPSV